MASSVAGSRAVLTIPSPKPAASRASVTVASVAVSPVMTYTKRAPKAAFPSDAEQS